MLDIAYSTGRDATPDEIRAFYRRLKHQTAAEGDQIRTMLDKSAVLVTARREGELIGLARGVTDGIRGYLTECKLDPEYQGPAAVTRTDGRIEHDSYGIGAELARRVIDGLLSMSVERIDVFAWGTEVDFLEELGFKRQGGLVGLTLKSNECAPLSAGLASGAQ